MPEFLKLVPPQQAVEQFLAAMPDPTPETISLETQFAEGRVLAETFHAPHPLPPFTRSSVDGFAVRAADTFGASPSLPAYLTIAGEIEMGKQAALAIQPGQAALVHTGGMIPTGANAVVMLEDTQTIRAGEVEVHKPAADGENILREGEDVATGEELFSYGTLLRPQEIGGLIAYGYTQIRVYRNPTVGILSSGDEIVPPGYEPGPGQVRDINSYTLGAMLRLHGADPRVYGIVHDSFDELESAVRRAFTENDMILITAGSSVSTRDITADVIDSLGSPGVLFHGLALRPGKPTILALAEGKPVIGLPGNPVSAIVSAGLCVLPVLRKLRGLGQVSFKAAVQATLSQNIPSIAGREDYLPVRLEHGSEGITAVPVFGRSNLIFTLVRADGLVRIPAAVTGLTGGSPVDVILFS
ncbi:MAG: molybdopterin molybdotransferase MoeA [Anaerolineales bacterium]|nr:molybdopterin molybdotransferase MoeA [Anaerolineales bacterium]